MKTIINEGHAGVMTLKDGTQMNYGVIRVTRNLSKMIFYTDASVRVFTNLIVKCLRMVRKEHRIRAKQLILFTCFLMKKNAIE